ncbi:MAG: hypothetical protein VZS44_05745 [Bacilli bacterium]|nr:hypothetical protein [Bacilli bacterium]
MNNNKQIKKEELKNLKIIEKNKKKNLIDYNWIIKIIAIAFIISLLMSLASETLLPNIPIIFGIILLLFFIFLGIFFDMIGVAVTASNLSVFNSMAARKVKGSKLAVQLKKNTDKVASFLNDVIGDICGVISGACCISIASALSETLNTNFLIISLLSTAIVSALTIGGKAIAKNYAINQSEIILYRFCLFLTTFYKEK